MKKHILVISQDGMTLIELILAIAMLGIVSMAAFAGFQYAFYTLGSVDEFSEQVYERQRTFENQLSFTSTDVVSQAYTSNEMDTLLGVDASDISTHRIDFTWNSSTFVYGVEPLNDFDSIGVVVEQPVEGGDYLDKKAYTYISLFTEIP